MFSSCSIPVISRLQLCRPLSGAVTWRPDTVARFYRCPSIVPPPFGSGYAFGPPPAAAAALPSIVPPPFGSGYVALCFPADGRQRASIVPPPFGSGYSVCRCDADAGFQGFNCAAPFRERLRTGTVWQWLPRRLLQLCRPLSGAVTEEEERERESAAYASIVPPPFGSGYWNCVGARPPRRVLQLCRPLSGAVTLPAHRRSTPPPARFNCAAPFRERLRWNHAIAGSLPTMLQLCRPLSGAVTAGHHSGVVPDPQASIVPPPFGSGYAGQRWAGEWALPASIVPPPFGSGYPHSEGGVGGSRFRASIVPPPFGSGYQLSHDVGNDFHSTLQLCRPLSGAVTRGGQSGDRGQYMLQLCRPLSGAVTCRTASGKAAAKPHLQLCRPLSGAVTAWSRCWCTRARFSFNCAAPFRERLRVLRIANTAATDSLQLCRPLSGAVTTLVGTTPPITAPLQLCRPLSGAVTGGSRPTWFMTRIGLQLCRPLSGAVTLRLGCDRILVNHPSIVPPPFGSGYLITRVCPVGYWQPFNCAAPFRERLHSRVDCQVTCDCRPSIVPPPFGSGYDKWLVKIADQKQGLQLCRPLSGAVTKYALAGRSTGKHPSIVPPPFGSGYDGAGIVPHAKLILQLCRPLSGAVTQAHPSPSPSPSCLQLCRPLSGAVTIRGGTPAAPYRQASIVPPPFGSGYARQRCRWWSTPSCFNCAAPFRERLRQLSGSTAPISRTLQLCRPLSGAVTYAVAGLVDGGLTRFNCAAPFRERLQPGLPSGANPSPESFNCAAPFRERLRSHCP